MEYPFEEPKRGDYFHLFIYLLLVQAQTTISDAVTLLKLLNKMGVSETLIDNLTTMKNYPFQQFVFTELNDL